MASASANVKISWDWVDGGSGKKGTTNVNYVNPDATDNDIIDFAHMLNSMTGNTFDGFVTKTTAEQIYKDDTNE